MGIPYFGITGIPELGTAGIPELGIIPIFRFTISFILHSSHLRFLFPELHIPLIGSDKSSWG